MEETTEQLKSIRILLNYADETGKLSEKMFTITANSPKLKDREKSLYGKSNLIYVISFSLKIPDHIHSYLLGKNVPPRSTIGDISKHETHYKEDFQKTITRQDLESVTIRWQVILSDYIWLKKIDNVDLKKVIFYSFEGSNKEFYSYWRIPFGIQQSTEFKFCVGYVSIVDKKEIRYNKERQIASKNSDAYFYNFPFVEYSESREEFFNSISQSFISLIDKMDKFTQSFSNDNIDTIISERISILTLPE